MFGAIQKGFEYLFQVNTPQRNDFSPRAGFLQFQTYPMQKVQGAGVLVAQGFRPGNYWNVEQPPQVVKNLTPVISSLQGGGVDAGSLYFQPLLDTSSAIG